MVPKLESRTDQTMLLSVQEEVTPLYIVSFYVRLVTTSWTSIQMPGRSQCALKPRNM